MATSPGRNDRCHCGSGKKYKHCCVDSANGLAQPSASRESETSGYLSVLVETRAGVFRRRVPPASPLRQDIVQGRAAEQATHDSAALWGLPDFVYRAELRKLGSGSRELGDGILIVGDLGIVIQVKSREALSSDAEKERSWIEKQSRKALEQAAGTLRQLHREAARMTNARGRTLRIDGNDLRWLVCVVIDHPGAPAGIQLPVGDLAHPAVIMLRRDWEFLFDQLKSTHAVGAYLERVAGESLELGREPARYYECAAADEAAPPGDIDPALLGPDGNRVSTPLLPLEPAATQDEPAHRMLRVILEDIATSPLGTTSESRRLKILSELDRLPIAYRSQVGRLLLTALDEIADEPADETKWRFRRIRGELGRGRLVQLGFGVGSAFSQMHQDAFGSWVQLRHYELQEVAGDAEELTTVGVLLTPRGDGVRDWDTTMSAVSGRIDLPMDDLALYRKIWSQSA
jgi:hypothetical protein